MTTAEVRDLLRDAKSSFNNWRENARPGEKIPDELWQKAVKLTEHYSRSFVASDLHLDQKALREKLGVKKRPYLSSVMAANPRFAVVTPGFARLVTKSCQRSQGRTASLPHPCTQKILRSL